ncbi:MysB family protein [Edaphovirga cremea]|uniref:MysB family protein n=1 Tax=Edaphovirga cremea TaxID=2267246 RepID=UPI000DEFCF58|nr:MysB family protein [Edaphovirga cremea]
MSMYATLDEAIETAREEYIESTLDEYGEDETPPPQQFHLQKYVVQDGDIMWAAIFTTDEIEVADVLPFRSGAAAEAIFEGDFDEEELRQEWQEENTLHEWDEGEFQLEPPLDTEEGEAAADEWDEK